MNEMACMNDVLEILKALTAKRREAEVDIALKITDISDYGG